MIMNINGLAGMLQNSLLNDFGILSPPQPAESSFDNIVKKTYTTGSDSEELEDYADISDEAYKLQILDGINIPDEPTLNYGTNLGGMILDYINTDVYF